MSQTVCVTLGMEWWVHCIWQSTGIRARLCGCSWVKASAQMRRTAHTLWASIHHFPWLCLKRHTNHSGLYESRYFIPHSQLPSLYWIKNLLLDLFLSLFFSESVRLLVAAGAHIKEEDWFYALATDQTDLLQLILEYRWICPPETLTRCGSGFQHDGKVSFKLQELRDLLCVALEYVHFAPCWLPVLLNAGLQPSLLLHPHMWVCVRVYFGFLFNTISLKVFSFFVWCCRLEHAESDALNYLLDFVNWTSLRKDLKNILERRREEQTWKPWPHFGIMTELTKHSFLIMCCAICYNFSFCLQILLPHYPTSVDWRSG